VSFVTTQPETLMVSAANLQGIDSAMSAANGAAATPTTRVVPAAAGEVSALTATQFTAHTRMYQAVSTQPQAIHEMFVNTLGTSAGSYAATEAANAVAAGSGGGGSPMDFGALPPEVNSAHIYTGPESGPMLAAGLPQC
jgi:PE family